MDTITIHERFIQFSDLSAYGLDAESLTEQIVSILQQANRFNILLENCVLQTSDRAPVMSGKANRVQKFLREKVNNPCVFVHCYAHRLNLVLSVSSTEVQCAREFFDLIKRLIAL